MQKWSKNIKNDEKKTKKVDKNKKSSIILVQIDNSILSNFYENWM